MPAQICACISCRAKKKSQLPTRVFCYVFLPTIVPKLCASTLPVSYAPPTTMVRCTCSCSKPLDLHCTPLKIAGWTTLRCYRVVNQLEVGRAEPSFAYAHAAVQLHMQLYKPCCKLPQYSTELMCVERHTHAQINQQYQHHGRDYYRFIL